MSIILNKNTNCLLKDRPWKERLISQVINTHAFMSQLRYEMATFQKRYCFFMTDFCEPAFDDFNGLNYIHHSPSFHVHTEMPDWHLCHRGKREARRLGGDTCRYRARRGTRPARLCCQSPAPDRQSGSVRTTEYGPRLPALSGICSRSREIGVAVGPFRICPLQLFVLHRDFPR